MFKFLYDAPYEQRKVAAAIIEKGGCLDEERKS